jgi:cell division transport system permease protein
VRALPFLMREAMTNLQRHGFMTIAAITTISVTLALLGAFLVTFYEIDTATQRAVSDFEVRIFCRNNLPRDRVEALGPKIRALPGVATVTFLSRDQVWAEQKKNYAIDISGIPNQMNDTYVLRLSDPAQAGVIARTIRGWPEVQETAVPEDELDGVRRVASFLRTAGAISSVLLLLGSLVVVSNTIRASVAARHREIKIMQIVGASPWFIRFPLLLEGLIHGTIGGAAACLCLYFVGKYVGGLIRETVPMLLPYGGPVDVLAFSLAIIGAGAVVGAGGSLLSMHRYLRIH